MSSGLGGAVSGTGKTGRRQRQRVRLCSCLAGCVKRSNGLFLWLAGCEMRSGSVIAADGTLVSDGDEKKGSYRAVFETTKGLKNGLAG